MKTGVVAALIKCMAKFSIRFKGKGWGIVRDAALTKYMASFFTQNWRVWGLQLLRNNASVFGLFQG